MCEGAATTNCARSLPCRSGQHPRNDQGSQINRLERPRQIHRGSLQAIGKVSPMSTVAPSSDIFLSYAHQDEGVAATVKRTLSDGGLTVYSAPDVDLGGDILRSIRTKLVESRAVIVILSPGLELPPSVLVEIGAAMAWERPIFVLLDGVAPTEVPVFLRKFRLLPISKLADVVGLVRRPQESLTKAEISGLADLYADVGVPVDKLLTEPDKLDDLTRKFNRRFNACRSSERLAHEILRLRKNGDLPSLAPSSIESTDLGPVWRPRSWRVSSSECSEWS